MKHEEAMKLLNEQKIFSMVREKEGYVFVEEICSPQVIKLFLKKTEGKKHD